MAAISLGVKFGLPVGLPLYLGKGVSPKHVLQDLMVAAEGSPCLSENLDTLSSVTAPGANQQLVTLFGFIPKKNPVTGPEI